LPWLLQSVPVLSLGQPQLKWGTEKPALQLDLLYKPILHFQPTLLFTSMKGLQWLSIQGKRTLFLHFTHCSFKLILLVISITLGEFLKLWKMISGIKRLRHYVDWLKARISKSRELFTSKISTTHQVKLQILEMRFGGLKSKACNQLNNTSLMNKFQKFWNIFCKST